MTKHFTIVGGGQSGLQLGIGLLKAGHEVRIVQNRTGEEIEKGKVLSSQCMFDAALQNERDLGINFWEAECPTVDSINFTVPAPDAPGVKALDWNGTLDSYAQSVDQRVKIPRWMKEFTRLGGDMVI
ncbi:MAG: FAD-binding oxidoreductase, partial [Martelella sp.]